ncbi:hypothetical protein OEW28_00400 [Defluviimonas sp. WL0002]|uniref:Uncharacterized protein n=1 Tax=Albidovulum marisflavi TaxID=2984159 RepID=A0ABT2Z7G4_9RHOB|nr:hypothetical protein [Defluviimonas sp. WL0002]MCV2867083.1 hypothetical protein [Defluviimonas sp. WL0002]
MRRGQSLQRLIEVAQMLRVRDFGHLARDEQALLAAWARREAAFEAIERASEMFQEGGFPPAAAAATMKAAQGRQASLAADLGALGRQADQSRKTAARSLARLQILQALARR